MLPREHKKGQDRQGLSRLEHAIFVPEQAILGPEKAILGNTV